MVQDSTRRRTVTRGELKRQTFRQHARYWKDTDEVEVRCPWCQRPIKLSGLWDLHEALVKRSDVPKKHQHLIFHKGNVLPVCRGCHQAHGQSRTMILRCLSALCYIVSAQVVGKWYKSLWDEHGLTLFKGAFRSPQSYLVVSAIKLIGDGSRLTGQNIPYKLPGGWMINPGTQHARDFRALCIWEWQGKARKKVQRPPKEHNGIQRDALVEAIKEGYWLHYLSSAIRFPVSFILNPSLQGEEL